MISDRTSIAIITGNFPVRSETFVLNHAVGLSTRGYSVSVISAASDTAITQKLALSGEWSPKLIESIIAFFGRNRSGTYLDIGANIGVTSALVGRRFRRVDCVEPNELVVNILKTNLAMNLSATEHEVHAVGLGKEDGVLTLRVPPDNFGGAYVEDGNPQFDCEMSARHSNQFSDRSDHLALDVVIREAGKWLEGRFTAMREAGLSKGVLRLNSRDMKR